MLKFGPNPATLDTTLYQNIANSSAHRPSRDFNANYIFGHPESLPDLFFVACNLADKNYHKACWILELVLEKEIGWLSPHLDQFCGMLSLYKHDGAIRSVSKICLFAVTHHIKSGCIFLSEKQLQQITEACFTWLIGDDKVASKAYAIRALFEIGKHQPWIYPELKAILSKDFPMHSAAYKAVAKQILPRLK